MFDPLPVLMAPLQPGEVVERSFTMQPAEREQIRGAIIKLPWYMYGLKMATFRLHLTNRRILIEADPNTRKKNLLFGAVMLGTALFVPAVMDVLDHLGKDISEGNAIAQDAQGSLIAVPYNDIQSVESFRQGLGVLVRLRLYSRPNDEVVFAVSGKGAGITGCAPEFVTILKGLLAAR